MHLLGIASAATEPVEEPARPVGALWGILHLLARLLAPAPIVLRETRISASPAPYVREVVGREEVAFVRHGGELLGQVRRERRYLDVLAHVLHRLDGVCEVAVPADEDGDVVQVVPRELEQVGRDHDVDALLHGNLAPHLGAAEPRFDVRRVVKGGEKLLLVLVRLRVAVGVPEHIVVVDTEQVAPIGQPLSKRGEVDVETPAVLLEAVLKIAPVDEDSDPFPASPAPIVATVRHNSSHLFVWLIDISITLLPL